MVDLDADLAAIFEGDDLDQVDAVFTTTGGAVTARGFFTGATEGVNIMDGQPEAYDISFSCQTADIAAVKNENTVVINAVTYTVKRRQNLGAGMSIVYLKA